MVYLISEQLPAETTKYWELSSEGKTRQKFAALQLFLEERDQVLEATTTLENSTTRQQQNIILRHLYTILLGNLGEAMWLVRTKSQNFSIVEKKETFSERTGQIDKDGKTLLHLFPTWHRFVCHESKSKQCGRKHCTLFHPEKLYSKETNNATSLQKTYVCSLFREQLFFSDLYCILHGGHKLLTETGAQRLKLKKKHRHMRLFGLRRTNFHDHKG